MKEFFNPYNYDVEQVLREAHTMITALEERKAEKGWLNMIENDARFWAKAVINNAIDGVMNNNVDKMREMKQMIGV